MPEPEPNLLTVAEAALVLRMDQRALMTAARRGRIPGTVELPGNVFRFNRAELFAWVRGGGGSHE